MTPALGDKSDRWRQMARILACPRCHAPLAEASDRFTCVPCAHSYPVIHGRPSFLPEGVAVTLMPESHLSNPVPHYFESWLDLPGGLALNLGAGGTRWRRANCIEVERAVFRHTDVVADAAYLPFRDEAFDVVASFNTFEHLPDPAQVAREIRRVLRPGGRLLVHTAFLQPAHEAPHHYYAATEHGVRHWFSDFEIERCAVSENFHPGYTLGWIAAELLGAIERRHGEAALRAAEQSTLADWARFWRDPSARTGDLADLARSLPQADQAPNAAGFELVATKSRNASPHARGI